VLRSKYLLTGINTNDDMCYFCFSSSCVCSSALLYLYNKTLAETTEVGQAALVILVSVKLYIDDYFCF
jgi:hypothetical protein